MFVHNLIATTAVTSACESLITKTCFNWPIILRSQLDL